MLQDTSPITRPPPSHVTTLACKMAHKLLVLVCHQMVLYFQEFLCPASLSMLHLIWAVSWRLASWIGLFGGSHSTLTAWKLISQYSFLWEHVGHVEAWDQTLETRITASTFRLSINWQNRWDQALTSLLWVNMHFVADLITPFNHNSKITDPECFGSQYSSTSASALIPGPHSLM